MMNLYNLIFKKILLIFLFVFSIIVFSACESDKVKEDRYNSVLNLAIEKFKQGNFKECIKYCDEATAIIKKKEDPFVMKSFSYYFLNEYNKGVEIADKAIDIGVEKTYAHKAKALNLNGLGKSKEALNSAMKHYGNYNEDLEIVLLLGDLNSALEKYEESIRFYSKCIEYNYNYVDAKIKRGLSYKSMGKDSQSIYDFESLQGLEKYNNRINLLIGELKLKQNNLEEALMSLRKTDTVYASKFIGLTFDAMNQKDSALFYYNKYLSIPDILDPEIQLKKLELQSNDLSFFEKSKIKYDISNEQWFHKDEMVFIRLFVLSVIILCILYFYILPKLIKRKISDIDYYDTYSENKAIYLAKYKFIIGGSWIYTFNPVIKNDKNLLNAKIQSIAFFSFILVIIRNVYLYGLNIGVYMFDYLYMALLITSVLVFIRYYMLDIRTCQDRVNNLNISYRKSISEQEGINREFKINALTSETEDCVKRLQNNIRSLKHI